jgi:O-acetyl-ADP-ribose deacetylase (regulator of RNase III)
MSELVLQHVFPSGQTLALYHGDLTEEPVDAVVNAANEHLAHGGGLAGALVRRGGGIIQQESLAWVKQHGPAGHAKPALTGGGSLPCRAIIHAVGPVWGSGDEDHKLQTAYTAALEMADAQGFKTVAFPSISTGIFGFPVERGAHIAVEVMVHFCSTRPASSVREIRFVLIDTSTVQVFSHEFEQRAL